MEREYGMDWNKEKGESTFEKIQRKAISNRVKHSGRFSSIFTKSKTKEPYVSIHEPIDWGQPSSSMQLLPQTQIGNGWFLARHEKTLSIDQPSRVDHHRSVSELVKWSPNEEYASVTRLYMNEDEKRDRCRSCSRGERNHCWPENQQRRALKRIKSTPKIKVELIARLTTGQVTHRNGKKFSS